MPVFRETIVAGCLFLAAVAGSKKVIHFFPHYPTILDKINGKPRPLLAPQIKDGKVARFCPSRGFILDLGGGGGGDGGLLFHFILSKIVASHADVLRGSSRVPDEPLRTPAWEATIIQNPS